MMTMKMIQKSVALTLGLVMAGGVATFAQSLADAKKAIDAEQYQKASTMLKTLITTQPKEAENYFTLGSVYLTLDEVDSAKAIFSKGVAADPKSALNLIGLGRAELFNKNTSEAQAHFDKAVALSKKNYQTFLYLGKAYFENPNPNYEAALPHLKMADDLETKDRDPEVFIALGDYWAGQIKNGPAYEMYLRALDIDPKISRVKVQIAKMFKQADGFIEGEDKIKEVFEVDPNYGPAYRELAEIQMRWSFRDPSATAKKADALANMRKYLDLTDKSFESRFRYAQFLVYAEDFETLASELQTLQAEPNNPKGFIINRLKGYTAVEKGEFDKGLSSLNELFKNAADASRLLGSDYLYLGKAYRGLGNDDLAITNMVKGIELDSTKVEELAQYGQKLFSDKKYAKAVAALSSAVKLNATNPAMAMNSYFLGLSNYWNYATLYNEKANPSTDILKDADVAFARVLSLVPDYEPAAWYRVRVYKLLDNPQAPEGLAVPHYESYITLVTVTKPEKAKEPAVIRNLIDAYNNLAAYHSATDKEKAIEFLNKTLALDPQNAYATETLKVLNAMQAQANKAPIK